MVNFSPYCAMQKMFHLVHKKASGRFDLVLAAFLKGTLMNEFSIFVSTLSDFSSDRNFAILSNSLVQMSKILLIIGRNYYF